LLGKEQFTVPQASTLAVLVTSTEYAPLDVLNHWLSIASLHEIDLRGGCFCNPGACALALGLTHTHLQEHREHGHVCGDSLDLIDGKPTGAIRASFGAYVEPRFVSKIASSMASLLPVFIQQAARMQSLW
jgi:hypothetical protein